MKTSLVMTIIGSDRPGLVERLSNLVADHGGNWAESRMAHLGGQFAGILRVEVEAARVEEVTKALRRLAADGLNVTVAHDPGDRAEAPAVIRLEVVGHDRPGIVSQLAKAIAARGFNVESLESEVASAPMTGDLMFTARAALQAPAGSDLDDLRAELERLADELMVDVTLE